MSLEGKTAPAFELEGSDGRKHALAEYAGRTVIISDAVRRAFWERESSTIDGERPVLVGWLDEPPLAARLGGIPAAASVCMVTLEVAER